ncbi:MAG: primosomal protein N', partial [Gammaproteobacteria bacterium]|nr:primosomal protein N' [Gammaproteobacteria bacterium]
MPENPVLKVAVPIPLFGLFDYLAPNGSSISPGCRVSIPFGRHSKIGMVMEQLAHSELPSSKLKAIKAVIDDRPILPPDLLHLLKWAADYYQYPLGEVISSALPGL